MFASNIFILSVIFRDSEFYFFFEFVSIFKIRKNSRILRLFHIHKNRILDLRGVGNFPERLSERGTNVGTRGGATADVRWRF